ncbi:MAG: N-acetylmuramoyl-L-alanine amidase [Lachnospiraceae bacterium]|nr:N-acetylmuramoyl-L-alanine amidase [Lachnospiraceae bacterium]
MATKIILDPGHGGYDNGASYEGRREKDDVLNLAFDVAANLRRLGYDVEFTRTEDVYDSPTEKARIGNASGADYFISLHRNSSPTPNQFNGVQTLLYSDTGLKADMARNINNRLEDVGFRNINVEERKDLAVLRRTKMPALLIEVGFINSDKDNQLFDANAAKIAEAIAVGIDETIRGDAVAVSNTTGFTNDYYGYQTSAPVFANGIVAGGDNVADMKLSDDMRNSDDMSNSNDMDESDDTGFDDGADSNDMNNLDEIEEQIIYQILVSIFRNMGMASFKMNQLINSGFDATANEVDGLYQVRVGAFDTLEEAMIVQEQLRKRGYETLIVTYQDGNIM